MTLMRFCENGFLEWMLYFIYLFFFVMERDLDALQQNSGMLNWRKENIRSVTNGAIAMYICSVRLVIIYVVVSAFPYRHRLSEV